MAPLYARVHGSPIALTCHVPIGPTDELAHAYIRLMLDYGECAARHRAVVGAWSQ